ncbi:MAG: hypothetical protein G01um10148_640 [Parcubacteria group bacterium Gr01-1014_8]|nr:MAG: hypothetical protein G01um10148_640 [Parcubacteria group bacterium Gr01-1014_8]
MTHKVDVRALASLARLDVSDEELARLEKEIPAILEFVEAIKNASLKVAEDKPTLMNVMRDDINPHEGGLYSEDLLSAAPMRRGNSVVVKQVLHKDKGKKTKDR